jgi:hypothetical protein
MPCWEPKPPASLSGTSQRPPAASEAREYQTAVATACDYCGSPNIVWRKCKLICEECKQINKSCADL